MVDNTFYSLPVRSLFFPILLGAWEGRDSGLCCCKSRALSLALLVFYSMHMFINSPFTNFGVTPLSDPGCSAFCVHGLMGSYRRFRLQAVTALGGERAGETLV